MLYLYTVEAVTGSQAVVVQEEFQGRGEEDLSEKMKIIKNLEETDFML